MAIDIGMRPVGRYYSWVRARDEGWQWNSTEPVTKTWRTFIQLEWSLSVTRDLVITEVMSKTPHFSHNEQVRLSEDISFSVSQLLQQFINVADEFAIEEFVVGLSESIAFAESDLRNVAKNISEATKVSDWVSVKASKSVAEAIAISPAFSTLIEYIRNFDQAVKFTPSSHREIDLNKSERFHLENGLANFDLEFFLKESFGISDGFDKEWVAFWLVITNIQIAESTNKTMTQRLHESFKFLSQHSKGITIPFEEAISIVSDLSTIVTFNLVFKESLSVDEAIKKTVVLSIEERFKILDEILRGGGEGIISDLRVLSKALTDAEFEELLAQASPTGYGPFVPFIAGDYDYQEALYKVVMRSRDLSRPYINQIRYEVDLPDLFDKGTETLTARRKVIQFNKNFNPNEPPVLTVLVKAGATDYVPEVDFDIQPGNKAFEVELRNPTTGTLVGGDITWKAQGY